jgi:acyl-CoA thioester hydrolase
LLDRNISFSELHEQGIDAVVARIEIAFKTPLHSGDEFVSKLSISKEGIKYLFHQAIYRKRDNKLCASAKVATVVLIDGKLVSGFEPFDRLIAENGG